MKNTFLFLILLAALTAGAQAPGPDVQFQSLFQIRAALPDTVELLHISYNISITPQGVEMMKVSQPVGKPEQFSVPNCVEENGRWIGVTKEGITIIWDTSRAEHFLEIATHRQVLDMYVMAPAKLTWERYPDN